MTQAQDRIYRLPPEVMLNDPASTQGRLWKVFADQIDDAETALGQVRLLLDIDSMAGINLDHLGELLRELRQGREDDLYKFYLKLAIQRTWSRGDINSINELAEALGFTNVNLEERFGDKLLDGTLVLDGTWKLDGVKWPARFFFWHELNVDTATGDFYISATIDSVRAAGVLADIFYSFIIVQTQLTIYTAWTPLLDGTWKLDGMKALRPDRLDFTPDKIALGNGGTPGPGGLANEILRRDVISTDITGQREHRIELDRADLAGYTINEIGIFLGSAPIAVYGFTGKAKDALTKFNFIIREVD